MASSSTLTLQVVPDLPVLPEGDLAKIKTLARACHDASRHLQYAASDGDNAVTTMDFHAPVATRMRTDVHRVQEEQKQLGGAFHTFGERLDQLAADLKTALERYDEDVKTRDAIIKSNAKAIAAANGKHS